MRALALIPIALLCACRPGAAQRDSSASEVKLRSAVASFEGGDGRGELSLTIDVMPLEEGAVAESVDWELWINTRHFASGMNAVGERLTQREGRQIEVTVPLVFRGLQTNLEPQLVTVSVRGGMRVKSGSTYARYPFEGSFKQTVPNLPVFQSESE